MKRKIEKDYQMEIIDDDIEIQIRVLYEIHRYNDYHLYIK